MGEFAGSQVIARDERTGNKSWAALPTRVPDADAIAAGYGLDVGDRRRAPDCG